MTRPHALVRLSQLGIRETRQARRGGNLDSPGHHATQAITHVSRLVAE